MLRRIYKYGLALCLCVLSVPALWAQKGTGRDYLRSGNRLYRDSAYTKAEVDYRKAIEAAQAAADAPYDSPEAYQAALDALEQAHEDLHDFVTTIDSPVTDRAAVWVRTLDGRTLFRSIAPDEALRRLPRGVFLFDSEKVYVR